MRGRVLWSLLMVGFGMVLHASLGAPFQSLARAASALFVATVNGTGVPVDDFITAGARVAPADGVALSPAERKEVVDRLVDEEILYQEALRQGLDRDPKVKKVMTNQLLRQEVYSTVSNADFTEEELQAYFHAHRDDFIIPEKVQIRILTVSFGATRTEAEAKTLATSLHKKALANPDGFKDLATTESDDPYKRRGGDVGFVAREGKPGLDPRIVDTAFGQSSGQISPPVRLDDAYVIVQTMARRERVERTYEQMKGSVLRSVKNERLIGLQEAYLQELRATAVVVVDRDLMLRTEILPLRTNSLPPGLEAPAIPGMEMDEGLP